MASERSEAEAARQHAVFDALSLISSALTTSDIHRISRCGSHATVQCYTAVRPTLPKGEAKRHPLIAALQWCTEWAVPGLGMFVAAYIIFSIGLVKPLQSAVFPECFATHTVCNENQTRAVNYVQLGALIMGMLVFGALGDIIGRAWGSRIVAMIMLTGCVALVVTPLVAEPITYLQLFLTATAVYGFGVGGEYPVASSSAAERSQSDPVLRNKRGQQVVLTLSQQGMGAFVNACVILLLMAMYGQTGQTLDPQASRNILVLQFAVAAAVAAFMLAWRYFKLQESKVWKAEREDAVDITTKVEHRKPSFMYKTALKTFGPRLVVTCTAWAASNFAFYGNKLFQSTFISALYPQATPFERMQWNLLNNFISLLGYYAAAALVDKPWYGRRVMQASGFFMMFVLFLACGAGYTALTSSVTGYHTFQALYFLTSFFSQFGPNCTTFLAGAEVFPTDVRSTFQGVSSAAGKAGALAANVAFGFVSVQATFYMSAIASLLGCLLTVLLLPDTTGVSLDELDRMNKYALTGRLDDYHGEAVNAKNMSLFERLVLRWHLQYDPVMDLAHTQIQSHAPSLAPSRAPSLAPAGGSPRGSIPGGASPALAWPNAHEHAHAHGPAPLSWVLSGWSVGGAAAPVPAPLSAGGTAEPARHHHAWDGPSWAASMRSDAAGRRLPPMREERDSDAAPGTPREAAAAGAATAGPGPAAAADEGPLPRRWLARALGLSK